MCVLFVHSSGQFRSSHLILSSISCVPWSPGRGAVLEQSRAVTGPRCWGVTQVWRGQSDALLWELPKTDSTDHTGRLGKEQIHPELWPGSPQPKAPQARPSPRIKDQGSSLWTPWDKQIQAGTAPCSHESIPSLGQDRPEPSPALSSAVLQQQS